MPVIKTRGPLENFRVTEKILVTKTKERLEMDLALEKEPVTQMIILIFRTMLATGFLNARIVSKQ